MKKSLLLLLLLGLSLMLILTGCGGGGGGGSDDDDEPCPYEGYWVGRYEGKNKDGDTYGDVYITIWEDGDMECRTESDTDSGYWTESSGHMKNNGQFSLEGIDSEDNKGKITGEVNFGTTDGTLAGTYKLYVGGSLYESGGWALNKDTDG